jgi:DNA mismatch repair protein MutL
LPPPTSDWPADARVIEVEIRQGGLQSIRVTDDGAGIPADEVALAFDRYATSKLDSLDQLSRIETLGFRGEALASIAAAANVRMVTRIASSEAASAIEIEGTEVLRRGKEAGAKGTTLTVEALFSTIPARLKFIRSASAETARIRQVVDHLAMASPHVRFSLRADSRVLVQTSGNGVLRDVVADVHGSEIAAGMLDATPSARAVHPVHGLVSLPEHTRANRTGISLFVNGRWIASASLSAAIQEAYRGMLMEGRYPFAVLFLDVPPGEVDVNVHPNKREVRFVRDGDAFSSVERSVREALLAANPIVEATGLLGTGVGFGGGRQLFIERSAGPQAFDFTMAPASGAWAPLPEPDPLPVADANVDLAPLSNASRPELRILGQVANTYIVAEGPDGLYLIDQHAAHESVLYYRLLKQWEAREPEVQPMLEPLPIELTPEQMDAVAGAADALARYGIVLEPFGDTTWLLRAVPAMARKVSGARLVAEVLAAEGHGYSDGTEVHLAIAASIACHSAIRAGQGLGQEEMEALGHALATETNPQHCPHGRPTTIRVTTGMLEREFERA